MSSLGLRPIFLSCARFLLRRQELGMALDRLALTDLQI